MNNDQFARTEAHYRRLIGWQAAHRLGNPEDHDDAAQEILMDLWSIGSTEAREVYRAIRRGEDRTCKRVLRVLERDGKTRAQMQKIIFERCQKLGISCPVDSEGDIKNGK